MKKFNREKALRKIELQRKWQRYSRYVYIAIPCILCGILGLYLAYSKFFVTQENDVVQTKVGDFVYGDVIINNYVNGQYAVEAPAQATGYKVDKIVCDNGAVGEWNIEDWGPIISNVAKRSKCNIYFVDAEMVNIGNTPVQLDVYGRCPTVNVDGTATVTGPERTYGYLCKAKDAYGDSYYYRGNVTNNYVKFAGFYWRIIRINGDGTVRVIYDGTSAHANGESSEDRQIGTSAFNEKSNDNAYIGYMYGKTGASTYAETHANINDSTIRKYINEWSQKIIYSSNSNYVTDNIFCNDRSFTSSAPTNNGTGAGSSSTFYRWYNFADNAGNNKMMLTCPQKNDAFTMSDTKNGNGALTFGMKVGLITADEVVLAGGWEKTPDDYLYSDYYYLYNGQGYWTMSPFMNGLGRFVTPEGNVNTVSVSSPWGVRPVFNLKSEVLTHGIGTATDPYYFVS